MPRRRSRCAYSDPYFDLYDDFGADPYGRDEDDEDDDDLGDIYLGLPLINPLTGRSRITIPKEVTDDGGKVEAAPVCGETTGELHDLGALLSQAPTKLDISGFHGKAEWLPAAPRLTVTGVGRVSLPVVPGAQATALAAAAHNSPGKAPLQISGRLVSFLNPAWPAGIKKAASALAKRYGFPEVALTLELSRLLFFRPGDALERHNAAKAHKNELATFYVQLPAEHLGGRFHLFDNGQGAATEFAFGDEKTSARFDCNYAVRSTSVEHGITAAQSGYRLIAEYCVVWPASSIKKMPTLSTAPHVQDMVQQKLAGLAHAARLLFGLFGHNYERADIEKYGYNALKADDRTWISTLKAANRGANGAPLYSFYLGEVTLTRKFVSKSRTFEDATWSKGKDKDLASVTQLYDLDGKKIASSSLQVLTSHLTENNVLNVSGKSWLGLWHGKRTVKYGIEPIDASSLEQTHTYRKFAILGWPASADALRMLKILGTDKAYDRSVGSQPTPALLENFLDLCTQAKQSLSSETHLKVFGILVRQPEMRHLFIKFLALADRFGGGLLGHYERNSYLTGAWMSMTATAKPALALLIELVAQLDLVRCEDLFVHILMHFSQRKEACLYVVKTCIEDKVNVRIWEHFLRQLVHILDENSRVIPTDEKFEQFWKIAIEVTGTSLCQTLVKTQLQYTAEDVINKNLAILERLRTRQPAIFDYKLICLEPLLSYCKTALKNQIQDLPQGLADFRYSNTRYPARPDLEQFLRGPHVQYRLQGFSSIKDARDFVSRNSFSCGSSKCEMEAAGVGKRAYVTIEKRGRLATDVARERNRLQSNLDRLEKLSTCIDLQPGLKAWNTPELSFHLTESLKELIQPARTAPKPVTSVPEAASRQPVPPASIDAIDSDRSAAPWQPTRHPHAAPMPAQPPWAAYAAVPGGPPATPSEVPLVWVYAVPATHLPPNVEGAQPWAYGAPQLMPAHHFQPAFHHAGNHGGGFAPGLQAMPLPLQPQPAWPFQPSVPHGQRHASASASASFSPEPYPPGQPQHRSFPPSSSSLGSFPPPGMSLPGQPMPVPSPPRSSPIGSTPPVPSHPTFRTFQAAEPFESRPEYRHDELQPDRGLSFSGSVQPPPRQYPWYASPSDQGAPTSQPTSSTLPASMVPQPRSVAPGTPVEPTGLAPTQVNTEPAGVDRASAAAEQPDVKPVLAKLEPQDTFEPPAKRPRAW